jgi:hypothetical protein
MDMNGRKKKKIIQTKTRDKLLRKDVDYYNQAVVAA